MRDLPTCRWRGDALAEARFACTSPKLVVSPLGVNAEICLRCYCRDHEPLPASSLADRGNGTRQLSAPELKAMAPCRHRGAELREEPCRTCRGQVHLKVLICAVHGECTVGRPLGSLACCATCRDYEPGEMAFK